MLLHNHPSGRLDPSGADLSIAARLHDGGVGFGIVNNGATELYVVVEVPRDRPEVPIDPFDVVDTAGRARADRRGAGAVRGPAEPARHGGPHRRRLQRRRRVAARGRDRRRQVVRLSRPGAGMGPRQWRAHHRQHQHDQPPGAAGREGPAAAARARWRTTTTRRPWRCSRDGATISACSRLQPGDGRTSESLLEPEKLAELVSLTEWAAHTADGTLADLPVAAHARGLGRSERRAGSLHPAQVPPLRSLLPVPGPAPRGGGRRRRRESSSPGRRPVDPAGRRTTGRRRRCCRRTSG